MDEVGVSFGISQNVIPQVYKDESSEEKGELARLVPIHNLQHVFVGAIAISDLLKTTLGPKGMVIHKMTLGQNPSFSW